MGWQLGGVGNHRGPDLGDQESYFHLCHQWTITLAKLPAFSRFQFPSLLSENSLPEQILQGFLGSFVLFLSLLFCDFVSARSLLPEKWQAVPYLAFKSLLRFLASSLFLLQQSIKLGLGTVFPHILDALCFSESVLYPNLCWMCLGFLVFVQEVTRKKISGNTWSPEAVDHARGSRSVWRCLQDMPRPFHAGDGEGFNILSGDIWHLAHLKFPTPVFSKQK